MMTNSAEVQDKKASPEILEQTLQARKKEVGIQISELEKAYTILNNQADVFRKELYHIKCLLGEDVIPEKAVPGTETFRGRIQQVLRDSQSPMKTRGIGAEIERRGWAPLNANTPLNTRISNELCRMRKEKSVIKTAAGWIIEGKS